MTQQMLESIVDEVIAVIANLYGLPSDPEEKQGLRDDIAAAVRRARIWNGP